MSLKLILVSCVFLATCAASATGDYSINWFECEQNATWPVTCGSLIVPLDYTNASSSQTLNLSLTKYNATKQPVKGSILFNPGGPGGGSREFLASYAQQMLILTGGYFDLIAFDTRGTSSTLVFSCFSSNSDRATQQSIATQYANASDTAVGTIWSANGAIAEECLAATANIGSYLGTAFVARDMMQIVDALGEDGLLRYYGATVAAMFPDRIDKMVLDGVVNSHEWYAGTNQHQVSNADAAVYALVQDCVASPSTCAVGRNRTADELYSTMLQVADEVKFNPPVLGSNLTTGLVTYTAFKNGVYSSVKGGIASAALIPTLLTAIIQNNATLYARRNAVNQATPSLYAPTPPEALYGIQCGDTSLRTNDRSTFDPLIEEWYSSVWGGDVPIPLQFGCAQWKMRAKEIYSGSFNMKTKNPILFISSPYDPAAPLVSGQNMSAGFEGSVLLQSNHIGHCTIAQPNACTIDATRAYFVNGSLPVIGTICQPNFNLFANFTVAQIYNMSAQGELAKDA